MSAQSTVPVETTVAVQLFTDEDGEDAGMVSIDGCWPEDRALSLSLCLISQYLARHVNAESDLAIES
jgi:hypothetical protein